MEELPPEIMRDIISRLPVKSVCRLKCVSKPWRSLISDPDFVANYPGRRRVIFTLCSPSPNGVYSSSSRNGLYSFDPNQSLNENGNCDVEELDFVSGVTGWFPSVFYSSCALFLSYTEDCIFSLHKPVTKESKKLPNPPRWIPVELLCWNLYGAGFDHSTNEHKVINLQAYGGHGMVISVYTLQTDSWRQIDRFPYILIPDSGILVNGGLHWRAKKIADKSLVIISFLFAEEEVREIPPPPSADPLGQLGAFRNWLCITSCLPLSPEGRHNEFFVMKDYGVRESWTVMRVSIPYSQLSHSGFWTESHDLMVFDKKSFVMYNFNDGTFWYLSVPVPVTDEVLDFDSVGTYLETLPELHERLKEDEYTQ